MLERQFYFLLQCNNNLADVRIFSFSSSLLVLIKNRLSLSLVSRLLFSKVFVLFSYFIIIHSIINVVVLLSHVIFHVFIGHLVRQSKVCSYSLVGMEFICSVTSTILLYR